MKKLVSRIKDLSEGELLECYHSSSRGSVGRRVRGFFVGFEIEKEDTAVLEKYPAKIFKKISWLKENDGSLEEGGFEFVSPKMPLFSDVLEKHLEYEEVQLMVNAKGTKRCGGHISLSHSALKPTELFEKYLRPYVPLIYALYSERRKNYYCEAVDCYSILKLEGCHDTAVELSNPNRVGSRIEFRIFPKVKNVNDLIWRRDLIRLLVSEEGVTVEDVIHKLSQPKDPIRNHIELGKFSPEVILKRYISYSKKYKFV